MQNASKVGLFVLLFAALVAGAYQFLGQRLFPNPTIRVVGLFEDAGGLNPGTKVLMAGVKIGQVEKIELANPKLAKVTMLIEKDKPIPAGSSAQLSASLIGIGDNPILIVPPPTETADFLTNGAEIRGSKVGALEAMMPDLQPTLQEVTLTLKAVRETVQDQDLKDELLAVLKETSSTLKEFGELADSANSALTENRETVSKSMKLFAMAMQDVQKSASLAKELLADPRYKDQVAEMLTSLNATVKDAQLIVANVKDLVGDPQIKDTMNTAMTNVKTMTESGTRIAENTEKMTADGTKITENGVTISNNVADLTKKANELADEAKGVFEKIKQFFEKTPTTNPIRGLESEVGVTRDFDQGRFRADVDLSYPISGGKLRFGIYDAFETNKLNVQLQRPGGPNLDYRYGIYAGQPGLGVDYRIAPKVSLRADVYGLNDPRMDVRARFELGREFLGWVGVNRLGDGNSFAAGFGIKK